MANYAYSFLISSLYALTLFIGAWLGLAAILLASSIVRARHIGVLHPSRLLNYLTPLIAPLNQFWDMFHRLFLIAIVLIAVAGPELMKGTIPYPQQGSLEEAWGQRIFGLFFMIFFGAALRAGGIPPALALADRMRAIVGLQLIAVISGVALIAWPASYWIGLLLTTALYAALALHFTWRIGSAAHEAALIAQTELLIERPELSDGNRIVFLLVTDPHLTASGGPRNEVRPPGNERLRAFETELGGARPHWLLVGGDLVDHGREAEWEEASVLLTSLRERNVAHHIVVAPGNHDLGTAYTTSDALFAHFMMLGARLPMPPANGKYLRRYLKYAAAIEPGLMTTSGALVSQLIIADESAEQELVSRWNGIRAGKFIDVTAHEALAARAYELHADVPIDAWREMVTRRTFSHYDEVIAPALWTKRWTTHFPLQVRDDETGEAALILNSIAPDPTLLGSAWGEIGAEQLERFTSMLADLSGFRVFVLCHHPPVRWRDRGESDRSRRLGLGEAIQWATHALLSTDIDGLKLTLGAFATESAHETIFLCGHRHGGNERRTFVGTWSAMDGAGEQTGLGLIVEGASFADPGTQLAVGWETTSRSVQLGYLR